MKTLPVLIITGVLIFAAGDAFSQGRGRGGGPGMRGDCMGFGFGFEPGFGPGYRMGKPFMHLDRLKYHLGLSDTQVEKIFTISQKYRELYFKNRENFDKIKSLREAHRNEVMAVLTAKQRAAFDEMVKLRQERVRNCPTRDGRGRGGRW